MSLIILAKINQATCSGVMLRNTTPIQSGFHSHQMQIFSPLYYLAEALKEYDYKKVTMKIIFANTVKDAELQASKGKGHIYDGQLKVTHVQRSTDIDDWLDSSAKIIVKGKEIDLNDIFESKVGKGVYLEIR